MSDKEYVLLNILLVALLIGLFLVSVISKDDAGFISCQVLESTGKECNSCGLTRDFISFSHFDFKSPINSQSIFVYFWFLIQLIGRSIVLLRRSVINTRLKIIDFVLSIVTGIGVFLPFWL